MAPDNSVKAQQKRLPTRWESAVFSFKADVFRLKRWFRNFFVQPVKRFSTQSGDFPHEVVLAESVTPLWNNELPSEQWLVAGKIHNLRIACQRMNGIEIPAGEIFSFWAHVGPPSRHRGFVEGRELREGCVIPSIAGGLCQLSNALYEAALKAKCEIIERYAHTEVLPGSAAALGRDATVFWNYVDLRFRSEQPLRIRAVLEPDALRITFSGSPVASVESPIRALAPSDLASHLPNSCTTCGVSECFRNLDMRAENENPELKKGYGRTAFLLDEFWPEYDAWIQSERHADDLLGLPMDGKRYKKANYRWSFNGFNRVEQRRLLTLIRALRSRKLSQQGAERQRALLRFDQSLAESYARILGPDVTRLVVMQSLLPHLWRSGALGGRSFDVLMTRLPIDTLQGRLDEAAANHPESCTLGDFRTDPTLAEAEREALSFARRIITPHREIADLFPAQAVLLDWQLPIVEPSSISPAIAGAGRKIAFCGPVLGRKGAYLLREAALIVGLKLVVYGQDLEYTGFWAGLSIERRPRHAPFTDDIIAVVQPAYVEHAPRKLLEAVALGIPVIASRACGLDGLPGVTTIETGKTDVLLEELKTISTPSVPLSV